MNSNIFNSIILSNEQVNYLMGGTAGINRLSCLYQLIQIVTRQSEASNEVGESTTELWEVNMSEDDIVLDAADRLEEMNNRP